MSTYTQIVYHLVFHTKNSQRVLTLERHDDMCRNIAGLLCNKNCFPYRLGGHLEHIHILFGLHPSVALSELVKDIKLATSSWIKKKTFSPILMVDRKAMAPSPVHGRSRRMGRITSTVNRSIIDIRRFVKSILPCSRERGLNTRRSISCEMH